MTISPFGAYAPKPWQTAIISITRRLPATWLGRRLALWLRKPVLLSLGSAPADVELLGFRMRIQASDNVSEKRVLFTPQFFDAEELAQIAARMHPAFILLDVGANAGLYSLFAAARGAATVVAVEPQSAMLERLRTNITLNEFTNIIVKPVALSDRAGEITFHLSADNRGQASLIGDGHALTVPTQTLLGMMDELGIPQADAMKIDIEGAEAMVLGCFLDQAPPSRWPKLVFIERNNGKWSEDIVSRMKASGYREISGGRMNVILELV